MQTLSPRPENLNLIPPKNERAAGNLEPDARNPVRGSVHGLLRGAGAFLQPPGAPLNNPQGAPPDHPGGLPGLLGGAHGGLLRGAPGGWRKRSRALNPTPSTPKLYTLYP